VKLAKPAMAGVVGAAALSASMFSMEASALQYAELELTAPVMVEAEEKIAMIRPPPVTAPSLSAAAAAEGEVDKTTTFAIGALGVLALGAGLYASQNR